MEAIEKTTVQRVISQKDLIAVYIATHQYNSSSSNSNSNSSNKGREEGSHPVSEKQFKKMKNHRSKGKMTGLSKLFERYHFILRERERESSLIILSSRFRIVLYKTVALGLYIWSVCKIVPSLHAHTFFVLFLSHHLSITIWCTLSPHHTITWQVRTEH